MSDEQENMITKTRKDLAVFHAVVNAGIEPTSLVLHGLWRWFANVDVAVPLPIMPMKESERHKLALQILEEMETVLARMDNALRSMSHDKYQQYFETSPDVPLVDNLWKELAGVYAELLNDQIVTIDEADKAEATDHILQSMEEGMGLNREEVIKQIHSDPAIKMQLRMIGLNPDEIN